MVACQSKSQKLAAAGLLHLKAPDGAGKPEQ
jgi:hypothetical protein